MATIVIWGVGQSNELGQTQFRTNALTQVQANVKTWTVGVLNPAEPQLKRTPGWVSLDARYKTYPNLGSRAFPGAAEARAYRLANEYGHTVYLFGFAVGGSRFFDEWPTSYGWTAQLAHEIQQAKASRFYPASVDLEVIVCHEGESDAGFAPSADAFDVSYATVMSAARTAIGDPNCHVIATKPHSAGLSPFIATVRSKLDTWVASEGPAKATALDASAFEFWDGQHHTDAGAQALGFAQGDLIYGLL